MYIKPSSILALGIVAVVFAALAVLLSLLSPIVGDLFIFAFVLAIILAIITRNKISAYNMTHEEPNGKVKAGTVLYKVALGVGIFSILLWIVMLVIIPS